MAEVSCEIKERMISPGEIKDRTIARMLQFPYREPVKLVQPNGVSTPRRRDCSSCGAPWKVKCDYCQRDN